MFWLAFFLNDSPYLYPYMMVNVAHTTQMMAQSTHAIYQHQYGKYSPLHNILLRRSDRTAIEQQCVNTVFDLTPTFSYDIKAQIYEFNIYKTNNAKIETLFNNLLKYTKHTSIHFSRYCSSFWKT